MNIKETAAQYVDYQLGIRRYFHRHPELTDYENETAKTIRDELDKKGIEWHVCGTDHGTVAIIRGANPGKTIMLRADIDALPVPEETGLDYASENSGVSHACGHDCHIAMLLTAAYILNDVKSDLCGTVKLAFQPAEELAHGAVAMIEDGLMDGVDACFGIHIWADVEAGKVACPGGPRMAGAHKFGIDVLGRGGHGAHPDACIDPIVAMAGIISGLQTVVSRDTDPLKPTLVTVGHVEAGATYNVIPDSAHMDGTIRCFDMDLFDKMPDIVEKKARDIAKGYNADIAFHNRELCPPVVNDNHIASICENATRELLGDECAIPGELTMGGEDYAHYLRKVPGAMAFLGTYNPEKGCVHPQHSPMYCIDEDVLINGSMIYAQVAADFNAGK